MPDLLAELRAAFPVARSWIYFNHAAVSPCSIPVARAVEAFCADLLTNGSTGFRAWQERREAARAKAARLLGALPHEIAFTTNTSQGLITVAEGVRLEPGDEILVVKDDFPANQIPWIRQERRGARIVEVPRRDGRVGLAAILERLSERTRIVAVPWVAFDSGFRLDLAALGEALRDHPALFCVDAIQGLGAFPLDVEACRIDLLAADSHKWMLGLEGAGLFYCRAEWLEALDPPLVSWLSHVEPFETRREARRLLPDARRFEYATLPTVALHGLDACLELLLATGVERMSTRILELTDALALGLHRLGWEILSPRSEPDECSGILLARPQGRPANEVVDALERARVSVTLRTGAVRFSPHAWNTFEEVGRVLAQLS